MKTVNAYGYLRVSGLGQVDGDGFTRQLAAIKRYAAANGLNVTKVFREEGVSGKTELDGRVALKAMLEALASNGAKTVIIERLDRLARDLMVQENIIADLRKRGFELISVAEPDLCSNDPSRVLMRQIFGSIAQYDRAMTVAKLRGARERMRITKGRCEGRKPYGEHPEHQAEREVIKRIRELRQNGLPLLTIAKVLNDEGRRSRSGKTWHPTQVSRVITRAAAVSA
ncbi:recombinase family protein [Tunturiibacter gelidiferens]|uniref:recombinase family protein n=1 Tax=Tunturiibacter gelidiferens TaxID=3069689 RepID=UPI003D9B6916